MRQPARPRSSSTDKISQQSQGRERNRAMRCARGEGSAGPCCTNGISHSYSPYTCFIKRLLELGLARNFLREAPFRSACTHDCELRPGYQRGYIVWAAHHRRAEGVTE